MKRLFLVVLMSGVSAGCMTMGKPFDVSDVPKIQIGKTTRADVESMFGKPYRTGVEDGDDTATWLYYHMNAFSDQLTKDLFVRFNADQTVKSYAFNSNFPGDEAAVQAGRKKN